MKSLINRVDILRAINLSITDFAIPSPLTGSIDSYSGFGQASKRAIAIHQELQNKLSKEHEHYESEVWIKHTFAYKGLRFNVSGKMDGRYEDTPVIIEEIKTAFEPRKLLHALEDTWFTHPYWLQLQTYGYFQWLKTNQLPDLNLLVVSLRNKKKFPLSFKLDVEAYEIWLNRRLTELHEDVARLKKLISRRMKTSAKLTFPFETPRAHQQALIDTVTTTMQKKIPLLLQAPTGLGKTIGVLFPALQESLTRGQKTLYLTPKNSQHRVALEAVLQLQRKKAPIKSITLTSKKKLCMKNEPLCNSTFCEFAKDHYTKVTEHQLLDITKRQKNLQAPFFKKMAARFQVCPYELQMQSISHTDVVIGDYNYVFAPGSSSQRVMGRQMGESARPNVIIDEAHNLPARSLDYYSGTLKASVFEAWKKAAISLVLPYSTKVAEAIDTCIQIINQCAQTGLRQPHKIDIPHKLFHHHLERLNQLLGEYLESDAEIGTDDPVLKLFQYWSDFTDTLDSIQEDNDAFFTSFHPTEHALKITCCEASPLLTEHYGNFEQIIGFSATLKPFTYYSQMMGLRHAYTQEFATPFSRERRKLMLIPQISTKYSERSRHYSRLIEVIRRITEVRPGNYFIFFPSFEFLEQIYHRYPKNHSFIVLRQTRGMHDKEVNDLLSRLERPGLHHLFFAVQGGMLAEGINYPGDLAIGAFIAGPPLPMFDWEREQLKQYYERHYKAGKEYAYIYPAMAKSVQAAGRVIRSETDKGVIVLLDNRFLEKNYAECMPKDWYESQPQEMISTAILADLKQFWNSMQEAPYPVKSDSALLYEENISI